MQLLNLKIDKIILHQVFRRDADGNKVAPTQSHEYTRFDRDAMEAFMSRVRDALGDGSSAVQMEIVNQNTNDLPSLVDQIIVEDDATFAVSSYDVANKLTDAQQKRTIPGGIVVVFTGTQGTDQKKFLGVIKAEVHSGYEKETNEDTGEISLKFVEELLLTPGTRLFKTAGFFEKSGAETQSSNLNDRWVVMVSDSQINKADGKAAAQYFYSDFLGCGYPQTSARTTKQFYDATTKFISEMSVPETQKNDLNNALTTYLKVDNASSINSADFAEKYFTDADTQDAYTNFIKEAGLPDTAFTKDIEHIESKLKFRQIRFRSNVKVTAPSEVFKKLVTIETIPGEPDETGAPSEWTRIIVKDRISGQE